MSFSLDQKIKHWEREIEYIYKKFKTKENFFHLNHKDVNKCSPSNHFLFKDQKCKNCNFIYNHISFHPEDRSMINIPTGKRAGKCFQIISSDGTDKYELQEDIKWKNNIIGKKFYKIYREEFFCVTNVRYYSTRDLTVNISMMLMIMRLYSVKKNFPLYPDFVYFYNCSGKNYLLYISKEFESIDIFNKDPNYNNSCSPLARKRKINIFSRDTVINILFQCVVSLKFYSNLFFTHNDLDYTKLRFSSNAINIHFNDKNYQSQFKCFIFPSSYSCICIYDSESNWWSRFFFNNPMSEKDERLKIPCQDLLFESNGTKSYYLHDEAKIKEYIDIDMSNRVFFYRLNEKMNYFIKLRRKSGVVFLINSFDIITLICSLMTLPYFNETILDDPKLSKLWFGLWRNSESKKITEILTGQRNPLKFDDICLIIKKFYIRFDALEYLYNCLNSI